MDSFFDCKYDFEPYMPAVLSRLEKCFGRIKNKYYHTEHILNPNHSCQWLAFLYVLSNEMYKHGVSSDECSKIYYLNKIMNSIDLFYEVGLPEYWFCDHPLGTVLGRAKYGNYFTFLQGCTVGNNNGIYPVFGDFVTMYSNSSVLGNCNIGKNVIIGANTCIKDEDIPDNCLVFGSSPNLVIKQKTEKEMRKYFEAIWNI